MILIPSGTVLIELLKNLPFGADFSFVQFIKNTHFHVNMSSKLKIGNISRKIVTTVTMFVENDS